MAFVDYWNEVKGFVPKLSPILAQTLVNRAWADIRATRLWSFLVADGGLASPSTIDGGTVAVTQGTLTVTADGTAKPLLNTAALDILNPLVTRQFRVTSEGPIYKIADWDNSTGVMTLDRPYVEATNASVQYQVYRCYYNPPVTDFIRYWSIIDTQNNFPLNLRRYPTKAHLDRIDPQRGSTGQANYVAYYGPDLVRNTVLHEFWPHPTSGQSFQCLYQRKGVDLSATNDLPSTIPVELLMMRSRYRAYEWAEVNKGVHPELRGTDWKFLMTRLEDSRSGRPNAYQVALMRARKVDEEIAVKNIVFFRGRGFNIPLDASYLQSHDVDLMLR